MISTLLSRLTNSKAALDSINAFVEDFIGDDRVGSELMATLNAITSSWTRDICVELAGESGAKPNPRYVLDAVWRYVLALVMVRLLAANNDDREDLATFCLAVLQRSPVEAATTGKPH